MKKFLFFLFGFPVEMKANEEVFSNFAKHVSKLKSISVRIGEKQRHFLNKGRHSRLLDLNFFIKKAAK